MGNGNRSVEVYTSQTEQVVKLLQEQGCYYVKLEFVAKKYDVAGAVFLNAYRWYAGQAAKRVAKPEQAESAVWTFLDPKYLEWYQGSRILKLAVPAEEMVFFRMADWNKVLNLRYLGEDPEDEQAFAQVLERQGIKDETDVCLKPYYPQLKRRVTASWERLFRYDGLVKQGAAVPYEDMQAGIWCIKQEHLVEFVHGL